MSKRIVMALAMVASLAVCSGVAVGEEISPNAARIYGVPPAGTSAAQIRLANSVVPELYTDAMGASVTAQRMFRDTLPSIADYSQSAHLVSNSYCEPEANWVMWDTPFLGHDTRKRNDGYLGYQQTTSGFATGISRMLGETTAIGLAVGYDGRKLTGRDDYAWRNKADAFHAALYGGTALGCFFVDGYAGYSRSWQRTERTIETAPVFGGSNLINKANYNDTVLSAGLKASYVWILPSEFRLTPAIGLDYSYIRTSKINESGDLFAAIRTDKAHHSSLQVPISMSLNKTFSANFLTFGGKCSLWTPEVRAAYIPQFGAKRTSVNYGSAYGASASEFTAQSTKFGGSYGKVGTGLKIKLKDKFIFAVDYDYMFTSKYNQHVVTGTYGVSF